MIEDGCNRLDTLPGASPGWICCRCQKQNYYEDGNCAYCGHESCCPPLEVAELELGWRQRQEIERLALKSGTFQRCPRHGTIFHNPDPSKRKAVYAYCIAGFHRGDPGMRLFSDVWALKDMIKVVLDSTAARCPKCAANPAEGG